MRSRHSSGPDGPNSDADAVETGGATVRRRLDVADLMAHITGGGASLRVRVTGRSMAPFLDGGEVATVEPADPEALRSGDLVLFRNGQGLPVLHRILWKAKDGHCRALLCTKGDGQLHCDEPVPARRVLGRVVRLEKTGASGKQRVINLASPPWRVRCRLLAAVHRFRTGTSFRRTPALPRKVRQAGRCLVRWLCP